MRKELRTSDMQRRLAAGRLALFAQQHKTGEDPAPADTPPPQLKKKKSSARYKHVIPVHADIVLAPA